MRHETMIKSKHDLKIASKVEVGKMTVNLIFDILRLLDIKLWALQGLSPQVAVKTREKKGLGCIRTSVHM